MIGMSVEDWREHLWSVMQRQEMESALRKRIVQELIVMSDQQSSSSERDRLIEFMNNYSLGSDSYSRAMRILLQYLPNLVQGRIGLQMHALASVRREFAVEHDLIFEALLRIIKK